MSRKFVLTYHRHKLLDQICEVHYIMLFDYLGYIILFDIKLVNMNIFQIHNVPYITSYFITWLHYSIQYKTCKHEYISDSQGLS
jgi:hypothetical protein